MNRKFFVIALVLTILISPAIGLAQDENAPGLNVGTPAPDFTAVTSAGNTITLSDYYESGPVVLIFYRGGWCPYCSLHLKSFQNRLEDFKKLSATILAVSVDKPEYGTKMVKKDGLGFEVVSDPQADILTAYNVLYKVPDDLAGKYLKEYRIDLQAHSGRSDHVIAIPATYVINSSGEIIFAYANADYKVRTEPEEVLTILKNLK